MYVFRNVQGLLDLHTLLDNPFGDHPSKFPVRAQITEVLNVSRAVLQIVEKPPAAFGDILSPEVDHLSMVRSGAGATLAAALLPICWVHLFWPRSMVAWYRCLLCSYGGTSIVDPRSRSHLLVDSRCLVDNNVATEC